jgi:transcriptional repressor NrdR
MQCPFCKSTATRVVDSRLVSAGSVTWRRRACDDCGKRFTTYERVEHSLPTVVKRDGKRQPFVREKMLRSLQVACRKRDVSEDALDAAAEAIEQEVASLGEKEISSQLIGERVMERLKALDQVAYVRFASVYKSFRDIDEFMDEVGKLVRSSPRD